MDIKIDYIDKVRGRKKSPAPVVRPIYREPAVVDLIGGQLSRGFELLDICMGEVERYGVRRSMPREAFMALAPGDAFEVCDPRVYRHHVRELVGRYQAGESLEPGTKAEVLLGLVETSLKMPLNRGGAALYHALFREVLGEAAYLAVLGEVDPPRERWPGEVDDLLRDGRRGVRTGRPRKVKKP